MRRSLILVLLFLFAAGCGERGQRAGPASTAGGEPAEPAAAVCPPCRMTVEPRFETIEVEGLRFVICNPRCGEIVREDPQRFRDDALP